MRWRRFVRYALGSGLATLASAAAFALTYRVLAAGPGAATAAAFLSGALVNFTAGRFWAWDRRTRLGLGRDALAYLAVALTGALAAAAATGLTHAALRDADPDLRAVLVEGAYFLTYGLLFLAKFLVLDRLVFRSRHQVPSTTRA